MANKKVFLHWNPQTEFSVFDGVEPRHTIFLKNPKGPSPSDMLPMALIGCSSFDVVEILLKQRQGLKELNVSAEAVQDENPPWRFRKIHIHYQAVGKNIDVEKVRKAVHISEEKYCSVYATLKDAVEITNDVEVVEG